MCFNGGDCQCLVHLLSSFEGDVRSRPGNLVFVTCRGSNGDVPISGCAMELADADVVVATAEGCVRDLDQKAVETAGDQAVGFVRVPVTAVSISKPRSWGGPKTQQYHVLALARAYARRLQRPR